MVEDDAQSKIGETFVIVLEVSLADFSSLSIPLLQFCYEFFFKVFSGVKKWTRMDVNVVELTEDCYEDKSR